MGGAWGLSDTAGCGLSNDFRSAGYAPPLFYASSGTFIPRWTPGRAPMVPNQRLT